LNIAADTQWKQVETQYQRRFDLIPNLVESAKGVMKQEQAVFDAIAEARTRYSGAVTTDQKVAATNQVESALGRLLVITENYPTLKSSETVQSLMTQLEGTENRVSTERMRFNEDIQSYNLKVTRFPGSIMASIFGFGTRQYFNAASGAENAPAVKF
jgi:LemA protein